MPKTPKLSKKSAIVEKKFRRNLFAISMMAFVIKIFIIFRIQGFDWYQAGGGDLGKGLSELLNNNYAPPNIWYGADGENYLQGLLGLVEEGFYSREGKLSYWPAGYPLLMWPIIEVFRGYFFLAISLFQSALYTLASIWFIDEVRKTRASKVSYLLAMFLAFNPTLALNTLAIGYELPVVAFSLISFAAFMRFFSAGKDNWISKEIFVASFSWSLATFMQPRLLAIALVFFFFWAVAKFRIKRIVPFLALAMGLVSIAPGILAFRNHEVHGYVAISTNLGVTMRLGAGPEATGGYSNRAFGAVECPETRGDASEVDRALARCVVDWYLENPKKAFGLFWNKARFFWSPWFGPEANGTMARNPWNQNHPLKSTAQTEDGFNLIFGGFGKFISWIWMCGSLILLLYGFLLLWRLGHFERLIALVAASTFLVNLLSSMLTIGDHRFRIPSMGMSIFLQSIGFVGIYRRNSFAREANKNHILWPIFRREKPRPLDP